MMITNEHIKTGGKKEIEKSCKKKENMQKQQHYTYVNPVATLSGLSGVHCDISANSFIEFTFSKIPYFGI